MTSMRFSNERGKFTPVQKKNKGAFKRLLKKQLQEKQYTVPSKEPFPLMEMSLQI